MSGNNHLKKNEAAAVVVMMTHLREKIALPHTHHMKLGYSSANELRIKYLMLTFTIYVMGLHTSQPTNQFVLYNKQSC